MAQDLVEELCQSVDQVVRLHCADGEVISAKIEFVSEEDQDVICQVLSTNQPGKPAYEKGGIPADYLIRLEDIEQIEMEDNS